MNEFFIAEFVIEKVGRFVEYIGFALILYAIFLSLTELFRGRYTIAHIRKHLGRLLLFGLEIIVAADIILATVARDFADLIQLTVIVLIRVILEYAIERDIEIKE